MPSTPIHQQMKQAVLKYGGTAFSFDIFESPETYHWFPFQGRYGAGGIAYKKAFFTRVIMGDPLLPKEDWKEALQSFLTKRRPFTVTMATFASWDFAKVALETNGAAIEAQTTVCVNPQKWETVGSKTARIRQYSRKCENENLVIVSVKNEKPDSAFIEAAEKLVADWKKNSLKRADHVHEANLWHACEHKQYFALQDPTTKEFHAIVVVRPLPVRQGFYLWTARASKCLTGSLEYTIASAIRALRTEGATYLTFGPFQGTRPHRYIDDSSGSPTSRKILAEEMPKALAKLGYQDTLRFFDKFGFENPENIYNLIWPKKSWIRPYGALKKLFFQKKT